MGTTRYPQHTNPHEIRDIYRFWPSIDRSKHRRTRRRGSMPLLMKKRLLAQAPGPESAIRKCAQKRGGLTHAAEPSPRNLNPPTNAPISPASCAPSARRCGATLSKREAAGAARPWALQRGSKPSLRSRQPRKSPCSDLERGFRPRASRTGAHRVALVDELIFVGQRKQLCHLRSPVVLGCGHEEFVRGRLRPPRRTRGQRRGSASPGLASRSCCALLAAGGEGRGARRSRGWSRALGRRTGGRRDRAPRARRPWSTLRGRLGRRCGGRAARRGGRGESTSGPAKAAKCPAQRRKLSTTPAVRAAGCAIAYAGRLAP